MIKHINKNQNLTPMSIELTIIISAIYTVDRGLSNGEIA